MYIEIRDPSLVERLRRFLPRPDAPFDEVIVKLLEQTCRLKIREIVYEVLSTSGEGAAVRETLAEWLGISRGESTGWWREWLEKSCGRCVARWG